ncbi:winged helix-turn-helix domain-containing protein [Serratia fonticola]
MNYLIDKSILFSPEERLISSGKNPEVSIPLTTTANRLLLELVRKPNEVLSRAYLLKAVWEDNGYASSDASLNNNISLLRKNFATVSHTEVDLKTIPKLGFQLNAVVELVEHVSPDIFGEQNPDTETQDTRGGWSAGKDLAKIFWIITALALFISAVLYFSQGQSPLNVRHKETVRVDQLGKCDAFSLSQNSSGFSAVIEKYPFLKDKCAEENASIYYDFSDLTKDRAKNLFVAICYHSISYGYQKCENIKSYSLQ